MIKVIQDDRGECNSCMARARTPDNKIIILDMFTISVVPYPEYRNSFKLCKACVTELKIELGRLT